MVLDPVQPGALTRVEIESVAGYLLNEKAASTRKCYAADWKDFDRWCGHRGLLPLPALPSTVALYLSHLADIGKKASTISRRCAAIAYRHRCAGIDPLPTASEGVRAVLRGIRRSIGTAVTRKAPATHDVVGRMMDSCGDRLIDHRDRALVCLGFAAALRRSELVALKVEDLEAVADGYRLHIRRSKTDQTGEGQSVAVPRGYHLRPVEMVERWLEASGITTGYIFRGVLQGGRLMPTPLTPECASRAIKKMAARLDLDPKQYAGHSLRSGFLTSAAESGATVFKMMEVSRHKQIGTLQAYVRAVDAFKNHAGAGFL
jgi:site-specific recombinase XerD